MNSAQRTPVRRRAPGEPPWTGPTDTAISKTMRRLSAQGQRGAVHFFLQRVNGGLYVEREEIPRRGIRTCQSLLFSERADFEQWRTADPIRFEHPLLYLQLQRDAETLWDIEA